MTAGGDDEEVAENLEKQDKQRAARADAPDDGRPGLRIQGAEYNAFWSADPTGPPISLRTSQIVDPPDGRLPPLTREALAYWESHEEKRSQRSQGDDWEDRGLSERCIVRNGLPGEMVGGGQQPIFEIVQTPGYVSLVMPYGYVRIIPTDGRPHLHGSVKQWNGDSRGRWEGDTLGRGDHQFQEHGQECRPWPWRSLRRSRSRPLLPRERRDDAHGRALHAQGQHDRVRIHARRSSRCL